MEYVDWVMSFGIFIIVFVGIIIALPNFLPDINLQENTYTAKSVYSNLFEEINTYTVINNNDLQIHPFSIPLENNFGRSAGISVVEGNVAYGLVQNKTKFYNFEAYDINTNKMMLVNEDFEDYNYLDTFLLEQGALTFSNGSLNLNNMVSLKTNSSFLDYTGSLDFKADNINVYFNYIDLDNYYFCEVTNEDVSVFENLNGTITKVGFIDYTKTKEWNNVSFGFVGNDVFCGINKQLITTTNNLDQNQSYIKIEANDTNTYVDNFKIYKNSDLVVDTINNQIKTTDLNVNVENNVLQINALGFDFNLNFFSNLSYNPNNQIINIKDEENVTRATIFPNSNEFWFNINKEEDLNISSNILQPKDYDYYIEDDGTNKYVWTKVDLKGNETKTIYLSKEGTNTPNGDEVFDFFDDFDGTSLDTQKWNKFGTEFGDIVVNSGELIITNVTSTKEEYLGIFSNIDHMTFGKVLTVRSKMKSGGYATLFGYASQPYKPILHNDSLTDGFSWYGKVDDKSSALSFAFGTNLISNNSVSHDPSIYAVYNAELISQENLKIYKNQSLQYTQTNKLYVPNYSLPIYYSTDGDTTPTSITSDYVFVRKYVSTQPTINVSYINNNTYKVDITNNTANDLNNLQIKIPNNILEIASKSESLVLTNDYFKKNSSLKFTNNNNENVVFNFFDKYNNTIDCDLTASSNGNININNCQDDATVKLRFSRTEIQNNYPKINIIKTKENIITKEKLDLLDLFSKNLPYFIEDFNSEYSLWTKVNIPSGETKKIYVSKEEDYLPNGEKVFELFDDFEETILDTDKWEEQKFGSQNAIISVDSGELTLAGEPAVASSASIQSLKTFKNDFVVEIKNKISSSNYNDFSIGDGMIFENIEMPGIAYWYTSYENGYFFNWQTTSSLSIFHIENSLKTRLKLISGVSQPLAEWHKLNYTYSSDGNIIWGKNNSLLGSAIDANFINTHKHLLISQGEYSDGSGGPRNLDYIFVRRYTPVTPTIEVKEQDTNLYEIAITNNSQNNLVNFQIKIPNNILNLNSKTDSLRLYTLDDYYLSITNQEKTLNLEKGKNNFNVSKVLERYTTYLNENGEEEIVRVVIKPN